MLNKKITNISLENNLRLKLNEDNNKIESIAKISHKSNFTAIKYMENDSDKF